MRILQIISHYVPAYRFGGPQRVAHLLGQSLVDLGHCVTVCSTNLADEINDLNVPTDAPVERDGVHIYYEPTQFSRYWGFSPALAQRARIEMQQSDVVFVHAHYQFASLAGAWLARRARKPYVVFAHGSLHQQGIGHKGSWRKRLYLRLLEDRNFRNALFIAFNAPEEKSLSLYSNLGRVVPSGINPSEFAELPEHGYFRHRYPQLNGKICYLFLGRLDVRHKGLDMLIPAFARLVGTNPDLHLILAGPDEDGGADQVRSLAQQYGVANSITLTGMIAGKDKLAALQDSDVFVLPSRFEGMSIALLEALYAGLPVLVTNQVGLCGEIQQVRAGVVVQANTDAVFAGLSQLAHADTRRSLSGRGRDMILSKYTWNAIAGQLIKDIGEIAV